MTLEVDSTVEVTVDLTLKNAHNADKYQDLKVISTVMVTTGEITGVTTDEAAIVTPYATKSSTSEAVDLQHAQACFERDFEQHETL